MFLKYFFFVLGLNPSYIGFFGFFTDFSKFIVDAPP